MLTILDLKSIDHSEVTMKFILEAKNTKKASSIAASLFRGYVTNYMSIEVYVESNWLEKSIRELIKLHKDMEVAYFILRYIPGELQLAAGFKEPAAR